MDRNEKPERGKNHRKALEEWMERSAKVLEEYGTEPKKSN